MAGCCEHSDEPLVSGTTELVVNCLYTIVLSSIVVMGCDHILVPGLFVFTSR
jgi:hypothetical protein